MSRLSSAKEDFALFVQILISLLKTSKHDINKILLGIISNLTTQQYNVSNLVEINDLWSTLISLLVSSFFFFLI